MEPLQPIQSQPVSNLPPENIAPINQYAGVPGPGSNHKKVGPIVAALVVILLVVIAAFYILSSKLIVEPSPFVPGNNADQNIPSDTNASTNSTQIAEPTVAPINNSADDLQSLQNDLDQSITGVEAQAI